MHCRTVEVFEPVVSHLVHKALYQPLTDPAGDVGFGHGLGQAGAFLWVENVVGFSPSLHGFFSEIRGGDLAGRDDFDAEIKAGRFIVPFGAFAGMSHPGVYRTVTNPLMYNMGRQVNPVRSRPPVLPMPFSDEGVDLNARVSLPGDVSATIDVYAVNGLQGDPGGINFTTEVTIGVPAVEEQSSGGGGAFGLWEMLALLVLGWGTRRRARA